MKFFKFLIKSVVVVFAFVGFTLSAAYAAVSLHLTDTKGVVDEQSDSFWKGGKAAIALAGSQVPGFSEMLDDHDDAGTFFKEQNYCSMKAVKGGYPAEFSRIYNMATAGQQNLAQKNLDYLVKALNSAKDQAFYTARQSCESDAGVSFSRRDFEVLAGLVGQKSPLAWANSDEWEFFKAGVLKDKAILDRVEKETGISRRILVAELMAEQMRLFYSDRPTFKKVIAPLKVLGSMTEFSWGIFGIKPETAMKIEDYLKNPASPFCPGQKYAQMLDFGTQNIRQERFSRITNYSDHYYAYLYAALFNKEVVAQWEKNGMDISGRPEILATLFNIGFVHSNPNGDPQTGGAELNIENTTYSFGGLAAEFYYSGELLDEFPQEARDDAAASGTTDKPSTDLIVNSGGLNLIDPGNFTASLWSPVLNGPNQQDFDQWLSVWGQ